MTVQKERDSIKEGCERRIKGIIGIHKGEEKRG